MSYRCEAIAPPQPGKPGEFRIISPDDRTLAYAFVEADALTLVELLNRTREPTPPDLAKELTAWLDNNVSRCGHGYISVTCGQCMAGWGRG